MKKEDKEDKGGGEEGGDGFSRDDKLVEEMLSLDWVRMMEGCVSMKPFFPGAEGDEKGVPIWQEGWQKDWQEGWQEKLGEYSHFFPFSFLSVCAEENERLWREWSELCGHYQRRMQGEGVKGEGFDKRFSGEAWDESLVHDMLRRFYVMVSRWWHDSAVKMMEEDEGLSGGDKKRLEFQLGLLLGALSPSNFAMTNPEVIEETLNTRGQNLVRGMENFAKDVVENKGRWRVGTVDEDAFEVGENLAMTAGEVIYSTPLFELIQYHPTKEREMKEPLLIVPPVINKYYVMDLQEKNSFVKWAVDGGLSVFMISWVNPSAELRDKGFSDYVMAIEEAFLEVQKESGEGRIHTLGYCVGGTMLSSYLARRAKLLEKKGKGVKDEGIGSATLWTCLIDFSEVGDMSVFLNEEQMASIEMHMKEKGYFDAYVMASSFSLLRANDLIWTFVVNNYLLGKELPRFDLLYWNNDSTNLTERFFREYMDMSYIGNRLCSRDEVEIGGVPVDVGRVSVPMCFVASEEDHIAPWKGCFASANLFSGEKVFVLGGSGHVNGMINPPVKEKYHYRGGKVESGEGSDEWKERGLREEGSWWGYWRRWLEECSEGEVEARPLGRKHKTLGKAPGRYVLRRS